MENTVAAPGRKKVNPHASSQEGRTKECSNHWITALISHASKVMLKILQARLQHYVNHEFSHVQAGFGKGRGTKLTIFTGSLRKQGNSRKNIPLFH